MKNSRIVRANIPAQNTRLPLIGKIRVGEKRTNSSGKEYPVSLDYFKATGSYAAKFDEVYKNPDRIQIVFISDDDWQSCFEEWDGRDAEGRRAGYGDGETYHLWQYGKNEYKEVLNRQEIAEFTRQHKIKWRQVLTINFIIPAIKGVFGVWQFQTGGDKSSINAIRNTFDEIKEMVGTVVNIPFDLVVKKVTSNKPESKSTYPVVSLVPNISAENMEQLRAFFESGLDIKRQGMLTEQKLTALAEHNIDRSHTVTIQTAEAEDEYCEKCGAPLVDGVCSERCDIRPEIQKPTMAETPTPTPTDTVLTVQNGRHGLRSDIKKSGTVLDAAANTIKFKEELNAAPSYSLEFVNMAKRIKNCRTENELRELYATEPLLFDHDQQAEALWEDRLNDIKNATNG